MIYDISVLKQSLAKNKLRSLVDEVALQFFVDELNTYQTYKYVETDLIKRVKQSSEFMNMRQNQFTSIEFALDGRHPVHNEFGTIQCRYQHGSEYVNVTIKLGVKHVDGRDPAYNMLTFELKHDVVSHDRLQIIAGLYQSLHTSFAIQSHEIFLLHLEYTRMHKFKNHLKDELVQAKNANTKLFAHQIKQRISTMGENITLYNADAQKRWSITKSTKKYSSMQLSQFIGDLNEYVVQDDIRILTMEYHKEFANRRALFYIDDADLVAKSKLNIQPTV